MSEEWHNGDVEILMAWELKSWSWLNYEFHAYNTKQNKTKQNKTKHLAAQFRYKKPIYLLKNRKQYKNLAR
jgi:hypothetical protein